MERPLERMARAIVAHHLDILVERSDDGTAPGQPDGLIYLSTATNAGFAMAQSADIPQAAKVEFGSRECHSCKRAGLLATATMISAPSVTAVTPCS